MVEKKCTRNGWESGLYGDPTFKVFPFTYTATNKEDEEEEGMELTGKVTRPGTK